MLRCTFISVSLRKNCCSTVASGADGGLDPATEVRQPTTTSVGSSTSPQPDSTDIWEIAERSILLSSNVTRI